MGSICWTQWHSNSALLCPASHHSTSCYTANLPTTASSAATCYDLAATTTATKTANATTTRSIISSSAKSTAAATTTTAPHYLCTATENTETRSISTYYFVLSFVVELSARIIAYYLA